MKWPVFIMLLVATIASIILSSTLYTNYSLEYDLEAFEIGMEYINFLFPLIVTLPVGWLMYFERKNNFLIYTLSRVSKKKYLWLKWFTLAGSAGFSIFIIMFVGVLTALYLKPGITPELTFRDPLTGELTSAILSHHFLGDLFAHQPLVYGLLMSVWRGGLAVLVAIVAWFRNIKDYIS